MKRIAPFFLTLGILIVDQITKAIIVAQIPAYDWSSFVNVIGADFLRFIHVKNLGVALSIGQDTSPLLRLIFFKLLPLLVMGYLAVLIFRREKEGFSQSQSWCLAGILGGGLGNLVDRFFRPDGVVDWIDFKFFGIFGWERFPTFNIADSAITISVVLILISFLEIWLKERRNKDESES